MTMEFPTCSAAVAMDDPAAVLPAEPDQIRPRKQFDWIGSVTTEAMKECCSSVAVNAAVDQFIMPLWQLFSL